MSLVAPARLGAEKILFTEVTNNSITYFLEQHFKSYYNGTGGALTANAWYCLDPTATTYFENEVQAPATANLQKLAGVAVEATADASWGWFQTWGYRATASVNGTTDLAIGDSIKGTDGQTYLIQDAATGTEPAYVRTAVMMEAYTTNSTANKKVFIYIEKCSHAG